MRKDSPAQPTARTSLDIADTGRQKISYNDSIFGVGGRVVSKTIQLVGLLISITLCVQAQSTAPYVFQVLPYATVQQTGPFAGTIASKTSCTASGCSLTPAGLTADKFTPQTPVLDLAGALDSSVATALSVIPVASPASGVIIKFDPATGAELPASSSLGPIFTERAETIGRHKFYIGVSTQDFHFTSFNGHSIRPVQLLDTGGEAANLGSVNGFTTSPPLRYGMSVDVRLSQNVAFLTYGVTSRLDVSVGLPVVHAAISAGDFNETIFSGDGFGTVSGTAASHCWCQGTLTPGLAPVKGTTSGLFLGEANFNSLGKTGFGDMLLRAKGTVIEGPRMALALGADLRLPTGDEKNFLGTGATAVKPFAALSLYSKPWNNDIVFSPHFNIGWQFAGKSILGGDINATDTTVSVGAFRTAAYGPPFIVSKDYLPDVFSWAVGTEVAFGKRNTVVLDILGNQIGWIHGIPSMKAGSVSNAIAPTVAGQPLATPETISGLVDAGRVSFGQYSGSFGYKAKIAGNLVGTANVLVRFDDNGLVARAVPLFGLSYTF
jgi:hypothetical protein